MTATDQQQWNKRDFSYLFGIDYFAFVGKVNVLFVVAFEV